METWRRNLYLLVAVQFIIRVGFTLVKPYLPLYLPEVGVTSAPAIAYWAGMISAMPFLGQVLFSPMWGNLSDRYGRKPMIVRCTLATGIFYVLMAFATNEYQLVALRFLMGAMSGFNAAAIALVATTAPDKHIGYGVGLIQAGQTTGTVFGPVVGGGLAELTGYRGSFIVTGIISLSVTPALFFGLKENFRPGTQRKNRQPFLEGLKLLSARPLLIILLLVIIVAQFGLQSTDSMMSLYVSQIYSGDRLNMVVAAVYAASALGTALSAPLLGRLGDKHKTELVLLMSLFGYGMVTFPQAYASNTMVLVALRFAAGAFLGGIVPSVQAVLARSTPGERRGSIFGISASASAAGGFLGPMLGGSIAALASIFTVFIITGILILGVAGLCLIFLRLEKKPVKPASIGQ